jgi:serine/threonine protein phosphatase PrpC
VQPFKISDQKCLLLMVCDGHGGPQCAQFFTTQFFKEMEKQLPSQIPNWQSAPGAAPAGGMCLLQGIPSN